MLPTCLVQLHPPTPRTILTVKRWPSLHKSLSVCQASVLLVVSSTGDQNHCYDLGAYLPRVRPVRGAWSVNTPLCFHRWQRQCAIKSQPCRLIFIHEFDNQGAVSGRAKKRIKHRTPLTGRLRLIFTQITLHWQEFKQTILDAMPTFLYYSHHLPHPAPPQGRLADSSRFSSIPAQIA